MEMTHWSIATIYVAPEPKSQRRNFLQRQDPESNQGFEEQDGKHVLVLSLDRRVRGCLQGLGQHGEDPLKLAHRAKRPEKKLSSAPRSRRRPKKHRKTFLLPLGQISCLTSDFEVDLLILNMGRLIKRRRRRCPPTSAHGLGAAESCPLQLALVSQLVSHNSLVSSQFTSVTPIH